MSSVRSGIEGLAASAAGDEYVFVEYFETVLGVGQSGAVGPSENILSGCNQVSIIAWAEGQPNVAFTLRVKFGFGPTKVYDESLMLTPQGKLDFERIYPVADPVISVSVAGSFTSDLRLRVSIFAGRTPSPAPRYRNAIKLRHVATGRTLHSHPFNYDEPGGSGQQQVTAFDGSDDNDFWIIKAANGQPEDYRDHEPIQNSDVIRLQHRLTGKNLHSHTGFLSPKTKQQEVSGFGNNGMGDANDNWRIEVEGGGIWNFSQRIRLIHVDTGKILHSQAGESDPVWTKGQQEVACSPDQDDNGWWRLSLIQI